MKVIGLVIILSGCVMQVREPVMCEKIQPQRPITPSGLIEAMIDQWDEIDACNRKNEVKR
jgi:hypothetical protein